MHSTLDEAFNALSNPERRRILLALAEQNSQTDQPVDYLDDIPFDRTNEEELQLRMRHCHFPLLEHAGFIELHMDGQQIGKGPNFHHIQPLLNLLQSGTLQEDPMDVR